MPPPIERRHYQTGGRRCPEVPPEGQRHRIKSNLHAFRRAHAQESQAILQDDLCGAAEPQSSPRNLGRLPQNSALYVKSMEALCHLAGT